MTTVILCVGKLKEAYWRDAAAEYAKRLQRFGPLSVIELPDLPEPKNASEADIQKLVAQEGEAMLAQLKPRDTVVALCIDGKQRDSVEFAADLSRIEASGAARVVYAIGGSNGLSPAFIRRANARFSFSPMTFPHQLARVMLLEQLYRARKILANETYHK